MKRIVRWLSALLVAALCLSAPALADGTVTTTGSVHLRSGAGVGYQSLRTLEKGVTMTYDDTAKDSHGVKWYHVYYGRSSGWISSKYAKKGSSGSSGSSEGKVTTTANVNLRSGAGVGYERLRTVPAGTTLTWDKKSSDSKGVTWYRVSYKGRTGWITSKYTRKGGSSGSGSSSSGSSSGSGQVTTTGSVHMRQGPSLGYDVLLTIDEGVALNWDKKSTDSRGVVWYRVKYRGMTGWVSSRYAKSGGGSTPKPSPASGTQVVGDTGKSNVHTGPGLAYDTLGVLHREESATYLNETSVDSRGVVWYKISWRGGTAWVSSRYTRLQ